MNWKNLTIAQKLGVGFGLVIIAAIAIGFMGYYSMENVKNEVKEANAFQNIQKEVITITKDQKEYHYTQKQEVAEAIQKELDRVNNLAENELNLLESGEDKRLVREMISDINKYQTSFNSFLEDERLRKQEYQEMKEQSMSLSETILNFEKSQKAQLEEHILNDAASSQQETRELNQLFMANEILLHLNKMQENEKDYDRTEKQIYIEQFNQNYNEALKHSKELEEMISDKQSRRVVEAIVTGLNDFRKKFDVFVETHNRLDDEEEELQAVTSALISQSQKVSDNLNQAMEQRISRADTQILIFLFVGIILALLIGIAITRDLKQNLGGEPAEVAEVADRIARGDLTLKLDKQKARTGVMKSMQDMSSKLKEVISAISEGSNNIASASQQLSSSSQELSQGASEQASSVEEVSSSMEEMSSNIQQNTDNAKQTEKISANASNGMDDVGKAAQKSLDSTRNINEKIQVINDIAFQTNILALNAAVEAARAGEHGKGFAVVADEVRKLASKSKDAADEIIELSETNKEVTENAGKQMQELMPEIHKTSELVKEISAASSEQNSGAEQINGAVQQLNQVTQQNASASEEIATSSEELSSQADQLKEVIGFFTFDEKEFQNKGQGRKTKADINVAHMKSGNGNGQQEQPLNKASFNFSGNNGKNGNGNGNGYGNGQQAEKGVHLNMNNKKYDDDTEYESY